MNTPTRPRYQTVQALRFIAAALVVHAHAMVTAGWLARWAHAGGGAVPPATASDYQNFGAVGVDIFFAISGFIIARTGFLDRRLTPGEFLWKRIRRVVPIYWLLTLPWVFIRWDELMGPGGTERIVATLTFWPASGPRVVEPIMAVGWTLCFEMLFYTGAAVMALVRPALALPLGVGLYSATFFARREYDLPALQFLGNPMIVEFLMGIGIAWLVDTRGSLSKSIPWRAQVAALLLVACAMLGYTLVRGPGPMAEFKHIVNAALSQQRVLRWGIPAALLVLAAVLYDRHGDGRAPLSRWLPLAFLGDASYSIYLVNPLFMEGLLRYGARLGLGSSMLVTGMVFFVAAVGAGVLVYLYVERPLLRWLPESLPFGRAKAARTTPLPKPADA